MFDACYLYVTVKLYPRIVLRVTFNVILCIVLTDLS